MYVVEKAALEDPNAACVGKSDSGVLAVGAAQLKREGRWSRAPLRVFFHPLAKPRELCPQLGYPSANGWTGRQRICT